MRIFLILSTIIWCILIDMLGKYYFDSIAWQQHCYTGSPYVTQYEIADSNTVPHIIRTCSIDIKTGADFGGTVYADTYTPVIGEYLWFQLAYNRWVAFSLPINGIILQILTLAIIIGIIFSYIRTEYPKKDTILDIGYSLILAGALSHGYERIFNGYVVDFISVKYFAILNFADIFISIGACIIFFIYYVRK